MQQQQQIAQRTAQQPRVAVLAFWLFGRSYLQNNSLAVLAARAYLIWLYLRRLIIITAY